MPTLKPRTELSLVSICLLIDGEQYHLIRRNEHGKIPVIGGYMRPSDAHDWARAARRLCDEFLSPWRAGIDFVLLPLFTQPWQREETWAQVFEFSFLKHPNMLFPCLDDPGELRLAHKNGLPALAAEIARQLNPHRVPWEMARNAVGSVVVDPIP
jgi:hypothetical protein